MTRTTIPIATLSLWCSAASAQVAMPYCGSAVMILDEGLAESIGWFDAHFTDGVTRTGTLSDPAPGNAPFVRLSGVPGTLGTSTEPGVPGTPGSVRVIDEMRTFAEIPVPPPPDTYPGVPGASRSRQVTTLMVNPANILGTWSPSNDTAGVFVGNTTLGEQIAFTSMQRWGGPFTGVLVYGDFAIRYVPGRAGTIGADGVLSGLVVTSNIDFLNTSWADLANATITSDSGTLTVTGDLLISGALFVLDASAEVGKKFGTFSLTACLAHPDVDGDGAVDIEDLYAWHRGTGSRDVDANTVINTTDRDTLVSVIRCHEPEDVTTTR